MDISAYQHLNIRMSTRGKRPLRNLTPNDKVRAIQRIHNGETKASVSRDIGVPESTLRGWCKNEQKLRFMCHQIDSSEQLSSMQGMENPPEKRFRLNSHMQAPNLPPEFNEFVYSRFPLHGLLSSNKSNIIKKELFSANIPRPPAVTVPNSVPTAITANATILRHDYSQLPSIHNWNSLSLLCFNPTYPSDTKQTNCELADTKKTSGNSEGNVKNTSSIVVKNWAKESVNIKHDNENTFPRNDVEQNVLNEALNSLLPFQGMLQTSQPNNNLDMECNSFDWCKVFNASLQFMALASAVAALHSGATDPSINTNSSPTDNALYNELKKLVVNFDSPPDTCVSANSDLSNDSYSEPEDLSMRSAIRCKVSSRSQSPVQSIGG